MSGAASGETSKTRLQDVRTGFSQGYRTLHSGSVQPSLLPEVCGAAGHHRPVCPQVIFATTTSC